MVRRVVKLPNGEKEYVIRRYKIPGKDKGFLSICSSGNCYQTIRSMAFWVFDLADHPDANMAGRDGVIKLFIEEDRKRSAEALASAVAERVRTIHSPGRIQKEDSNG